GFVGKFTVDTAGRDYWSTGFWVDGNVDTAPITPVHGIRIHKGDTLVRIGCDYTARKHLWLTWDKTQDKLLHASWYVEHYSGPPMSTSTICDAYGCTT